MKRFLMNIRRPSKFNVIVRNQIKTKLDGISDKNFNYKRAFSTTQPILMRPPQSSSLISNEESKDFMAQFHDIVKELTGMSLIGFENQVNPDLSEVMKRLSRVLQYNVPRGKKIRGLTTIAAYKALEHPAKITAESIRLARILGWCIEMLHSYFLIMDDVMDNSETRRGATCWYRQPGVGLIALNDAIMIENAVFFLLKYHLKEHPMYISLIELFHDMALKTSLGQSLDTMCLDQNAKPKLEMFTMSRYTSMVKYKTSYYSFYLPVAAAMYLCGIDDLEQHRQPRTILLEMGQFFQIQDDFLDCFGDPSVTGKLGTDIQEGKCSWLAVVALQRAIPKQRKIMEEHYGRPEPESVAIIKKLYEDLTIPNIYAIYEQESYNNIKTHIQQISKGPSRDLFLNIMKMFYKRER